MELNTYSSLIVRDNRKHIPEESPIVRDMAKRSTYSAPIVRDNGKCLAEESLVVSINNNPQVLGVNVVRDNSNPQFLDGTFVCAIIVSKFGSERCLKQS